MRQFVGHRFQNFIHDLFRKKVLGETTSVGCHTETVLAAKAAVFIFEITRTTIAINCFLCNHSQMCFGDVHWFIKSDIAKAAIKSHLHNLYHAALIHLDIS
jgi:hypothetical protein